MAMVAFINSDNGLGMVPGLLERNFPGPHPSLTWLGLSNPT